MATSARSDAVLRWLPWATLVVATVVAVTTTPLSAAPREEVLLPWMALFFAVLLARIGLASVRWPHRRRGLLALLAGLLCWATGAALLNSPSEGVARSFPSTSEVLFLLALLGFAAFIVLDVDRRTSPSIGVWVDVTILGGAAGVVAAGLVLMPAATATGAEGGSLFVALIFPTIDLLLALVVAGQVLLHARSWGPRALSLVLGFGLLAAMDTSLAVFAANGQYAITVVPVLLWAAGLALVVTGGCAQHDDARSDRLDVPTWLVVGAGAMALAVLVVLSLTGHTPHALYLVAPAVVTLLAAGAKLLLALNQARNAAELQRLSQTDDLTGLPNRRAVLGELDRRLASGSPLTLLLLDLDGFKDVNDSLGHGAGDDVLRAIADRLRETLPPSRYLARLGGDEFAIISPHASPDDGIDDARKVRTALSQPVSVSGLSWSIQASIGVGSAHGDESTSSDVLRRADVAMYEAKAAGSGVAAYASSRDQLSRQRSQLADELRRGIDEGQIELWFQPQIDAGTSDVVGVEGLARWQHPVHGVVAPSAFLPVARREGLMPALSLAVARIAVDQAVVWRDRGLPLRVSFNLAPPEVLRGPVLDGLYGLLEDARLPDRALCIEVTEESFLNDPVRARELITEAGARGVANSIDDFGTGFSSLAHLRDLPVDELKIDRSFIEAARHDARTRLIIESTIAMAAALDLRSVAEGVEDEHTAAILSGLGIDVLQGFLYAAPMPIAAFEDWYLGRAAAPGLRAAGAG